MKQAARSRSVREESFRSYVREVSAIPLLTPEEERSLGNQAHHGDAGAITRLVESNLRFVIRVAARYRRSGVPLGDLINEGNLGLMEAAKRFDPDRDVRFVSYAVWWIRNSILKYLADNGHIFRLPQKTLSILYRAARKCAEESTTREDLALEIGVGSAQLDRALQLGYRSVSLDQPLTGEDLMLKDTLEQKTPSVEEDVIREDMRKQITKSVDALTPVQATVLRLRFGLEDGETLTLEQIAKKFGRSSERIRQIEAKALRKLRRALHSGIPSAAKKATLTIPGARILRSPIAVHVTWRPAPLAAHRA